MNDNGYISRQISVYKTDKKLVELIDKLNPAPLELYAHIHARGDDTGDNRRVYSNIGIILQDYSAGTGQNTRRATANLLPSEVAYIFNQVSCYLFVAGNGCGDYYCYRIDNGIVQSSPIYIWEHEDFQSKVVAANLEDMIHLYYQDKI